VRHQRALLSCSSVTRDVALIYVLWSQVASVMDGRPHLFHHIPLPPVFTPVPNYTVWWQKHNNLAKVVTQQSPTATTLLQCTFRLQVLHSTITPMHYPNVWLCNFILQLNTCTVSISRAVHQTCHYNRSFRHDIYRHSCKRMHKHNTLSLNQLQNLINGAKWLQ